MLTLDIGEDGRLTLYMGSREMVSRSCIGLAVINKILYAPKRAEICSSEKDREIVLYFEGGYVKLSCFECGRWFKLTVAEVSGNIKGFVFGPWLAKADAFGEMVGAAWFSDGAVSCIQSLNPKTVGGFKAELEGNKTGIACPGKNAACGEKGAVTLQCTALDMSEPEYIDFLGMSHVIAYPVPGEDAFITGAAVALTAAESAEELLDIIGEIELAEGLPHPLIDGEWAKKSRRADEIYFVTYSRNAEAQVELAERAGVRCLYFGDPFKSWGHFDINPQMYPNGRDGLREFVHNALGRGVDCGFHTLSNFIHTHDPYVTPLPNERLLKMDETVIAKRVSETDAEIFVRDTNNFSKSSALNTVRLGDELIRFKAFDPARMCLTDCERGSFGTAAGAYDEGTALARLWDHGYGTLFPDIVLQNEMADRIGEVIRETGIRRMSFDGLEGCEYTGRGEYASSEFVRRVFLAAGSELICDASTWSHYRWHAHSYFNWGEPWYDEDHRGGMYNVRARHQQFFRRNLYPCMLGWYLVAGRKANGKFEATVPENFEFAVSRTVAFDAGLCFVLDNNRHGKLGEFADIVRRWVDFRRDVKIPDALRMRMQDEHSNWHLERTDNGWELHELWVRTFSMDFCENKVMTESGSAGYAASGLADSITHSALIVMDDMTQDENDPTVNEPFCFRLRVGKQGEKGTLSNLSLSAGWFGSDRIISFKFTANTGEYLEYNGGTALKRLDGNFQVLETVEGAGGAVSVPEHVSNAVTVHYETEKDSTLSLALSVFRTARIYKF